MPEITSSRGVKSKLEIGFYNFGQFVSRQPVKVLAFIVVSIAIFATQLQYIRTDSSIEGFLKKNDEKIITYEQFKDTFGRDQGFIISIETDEIFDQVFSNKLRNFHQDLENSVPYIKTLDPLTNARYTFGENDTLFIKDLLPEVLPEDPAEILELKEYALSSPTYLDYLISRDGKLTTVILKLNAYNFVENPDGSYDKKNLEDFQLREAYKSILTVIEKHTGVLSDEIYVAGTLPVSILLAEIVTHDFAVFSILAILVIGVVLSIIFKRASSVFMPLFISRRLSYRTSIDEGGSTADPGLLLIMTKKIRINIC